MMIPKRYTILLATTIMKKPFKVATTTHFRQYKITKYENIENKTKGMYEKIVKLYIEVTSTGFSAKDIEDSLILMKNKNIHKFVQAGLSLFILAMVGLQNTF